MTTGSVDPGQSRRRDKTRPFATTANLPPASNLSPFVIFAGFLVLVGGTTAVSWLPVRLVSLVCGWVCLTRLWWAFPMWVLCLTVVTVAVNPLINHRGAVVLLYLPDGNPLTAESLWSGVNLAVLLGAVCCWFGCFHVLMTADKLCHLLAKCNPLSALLLTISLRYVPRLRTEARRIARARRCLDALQPGRGRRKRPLHDALQTISALATWSLEESGRTADQMRARGFGLPNRTAFTIYGRKGA